MGHCRLIGKLVSKPPNCLPLRQPLGGNTITHMVNTVCYELPRICTSHLGFLGTITHNIPTRAEALGWFVARLLFAPWGVLHIYRDIGSAGHPVIRFEVTCW